MPNFRFRLNEFLSRKKSEKCSTLFAHQDLELFTPPKLETGYFLSARG